VQIYSGREFRHLERHIGRNGDHWLSPCEGLQVGFGKMSGGTL